MISKVIYIVKSDLHFYPPCISQIKNLKNLGVDITVWYGSTDSSLLHIFDDEEITHKCIPEVRGKFRGKLDKVNNWKLFGENVSKEIAKIEISDLNKTLFWFGTAETSIPMFGKLKNLHYVLTSLELLDDDFFKRIMFGKLTKRAKAIVACEETRAYIMRYWYKLDTLPYVMPNKPYELNVKRRCEPSTDITRKAIELIKDKQFIIYQGILKSKGYMLEMAKALNIMNSEYYFVLMGQDPEDIYKDIKKFYEKTIFIKNIPAPLHLEVTSYAKIGFVFYDDRSTLNRAFCAPNKIYEYSGLGIPSLGNKVPGLMNTIGSAHAGECVDLTAIKLVEAIKAIESNYEEYSSNAETFYSYTDNNATMRKIISDLKIKQGKSETICF